MNRFFLILLLLCLMSCDDNKQKQAESIVKEIMCFKQDNGYYPDSLEQIFKQSTDQEVYFYDRDTLNNEFVLYYGLVLGESVFFSSKDSSWHHEY